MRNNVACIPLDLGLYAYNSFVYKQVGNNFYNPNLKKTTK